MIARMRLRRDCAVIAFDRRHTLGSTDARVAVLDMYHALMVAWQVVGEVALTRTAPRLRRPLVGRGGPVQRLPAPHMNG